MKRKKEKKSGSSGRNWILKHAKTQFGKIILLSVLCMASSGIGVFLALALKSVVDYAVSGNRNAFVMAGTGTALLILVQIAIGCLVRYFDERIRSEVENHLKGVVWKNLMHRDYASLEQYHTGDLMTRLSNDVRLVSDNMVTLIPSFCSTITRLILALCILFFLDKKFALIFMAGGVAAVGVSYLLRKKMKNLHKEMQKADGRVRSFQQEMLESLLVIRSFRAEEKMAELSNSLMSEHRKMRLKKNLFSNTAQTGFSLIMNMGYLFGIFWCGFGILNHTITYGTLLAVQQLVGQVQQPLANMSGFVPRYYAMTASAERIMEVDELPEDNAGERENPNEIVKQEQFEKIVLKGVKTSYKNGELILDHADLAISGGDMIAVMGQSGAGKSTLLKLLLGIYPIEAGNATLVYQGGELPIGRQSRGYFAYVPQGNFLLSGTIREVITMYGMEGKISVEEACRIACADEFIQKLPNGLDTRLQERGEGLSEGQMQRLAIARAVYMGAPVLLLDEATSALDGWTEAKVLKNIRELKNKTVIIVTHRPAALEICSRQILVEKKQISEKITWKG